MNGKKMGVKALSLVMVLMMLFGVCAPVVNAAADLGAGESTTSSEDLSKEIFEKLLEGENDDTIIYVSIGDSMTNGYGLEGYDGNSGIVNYANDTYANQFAAWLAGYDGAIVDDQVIFKDDNRIVDHRQLAMSGMRAEDLHWVLELDYSKNKADQLEEIYDTWYANENSADRGWITNNVKNTWYNTWGFTTGDFRTWSDFCDGDFRYADGAARILATYSTEEMQKYFKSDYADEATISKAIDGIADTDKVEKENGTYFPRTQEEVASIGGYKYLQIATEFYQESVKDADVISLALGNTNFGTYMLSAIMDVVMYGKTDSFTGTYDIEKVFELADMDSEMKAKVRELIDECDVIIDQYFSDLAGGDAAKMEALRYIIDYCVASYIVNYIGSIDAILTLNPDVDIIQVALMNAYAKDNANKDDTTIGDIVDVLYTPINAFIAALPTYMQLTGKDLYKNATFYYAEAETVECMVSVFGDDFYYNNSDGKYIKYSDLDLVNGNDSYTPNLNSTVRDRFVENIVGGETFRMINQFGFTVSSDISVKDIANYDLADGAGKIEAITGNQTNAMSYALYLAFERATIEAGKGTVTTDSLAALGNLASAFTELLAGGTVRTAAIAGGWTTYNDSVADFVLAQVPDNYSSGMDQDTVKNWYEGKSSNAILEGISGLRDTVNNICYLLGLPKALSDAMISNTTISGILCMNARMLIGTGIGGHPSQSGHNALAVAVIYAYENEKTFQDETMKNALKALEIAKNLVLEYYDEAYEYAYNYADENGYIDTAEVAIDQAITAIQGIDLDKTDMTDKFKAELQKELDAVVATLEKIRDALANGQFATVDDLVSTVTALEDDLYTHLTNVKALAMQAGSDVYKLVVLPAIDHVKTVTIPAVKAAVQAMVEQVCDYVTGKIADIYGVVINVNASIQDVIDRVQAAIANKIATALGIVVDANATVQKIINAIRDHLDHVRAGEYTVKENSFYLAITDGSEAAYADIVRKGLWLTAEEFAIVSMDQVTPELIETADFITVSYDDSCAVDFAYEQVLGIANEYIEYATEYLEIIDKKFETGYPSLVNNFEIDIYDIAMSTVNETAGEYLSLVAGKKPVDLDWETLVGQDNLPYVVDVHNKLMSALVAAGVPETYSISIDVIAEVSKIVSDMTDDAVEFNKNKAAEVFGEHSVFSLEIPVAEIISQIIESALYEYISYNKAYADTLTTIEDTIIELNSDATVAVLGNYNRYLDYELQLGEKSYTLDALLSTIGFSDITIPEMTFSLADILSNIDFGSIAVPEEISTFVNTINSMDDYEINIPVADLVTLALGAYDGAMEAVISFELPVCDKANAMIDSLLGVCDAYVQTTADKLSEDPVYTITIPVANLVAYANAYGEQLDTLIRTSLETEITVGGESVTVNDVLDVVANITSIHPFAYAVMMPNVFYVDIADANVDIAAQILGALTVTCEHTYDNPCDDAYCNRCNEKRNDLEQHQWDEGSTSSGNCITPSSTTWTCTICGKTKSESGSYGSHSYGNYTSNNDATCKADGTKTATCGLCLDRNTVTDAGSKLPHTEKTIPAVDATCSATGLTEGKKCSVCGEITVKQTEIAKLPHTEETLSAVDATCSATGLTEGKKCSVCGEITVKQTEIDKIPHTEETIPAVGATCSASGLTEGKKCSVCGEITVAQTEIAMLPHTEEIVPAVDATCSATGLTEGKKCSVCGEIIVAQTEIAKLPHTEEIVPDADATCSATGLTEGKKCSVCGEITVAQEAINALGHIWTDATCTVAKTCSVCGETEGDALGHTWTDATCTDPKTCTVCGETEGDALGHTYANDCDADCDTCGTTRTPADHVYGEWTVVTEATKKAEGKQERTCTVCGNVESAVIPMIEQNGLSTGAIVGIIVAVVVILGGGTVGVLFIIKKKKS